MSSVQNARALEAALQTLQGPAATGKLLVKPAPLPDGSPGPDATLEPGDCAVPVTGNARSRAGMVFVKRNPETVDANGNGGSWTCTAAGTLVNVEAIGGGVPGNRDPGTPYRWDPPIDGVELQSVADSSGLTGGALSGAYAGIKQFVYLKTMSRTDMEALFTGKLFNFPAAALAWAKTTPLDGPMAGSPGPRTARVSTSATLYQHTWFLYLVTSRLDSDTARNLEADTLRDDVLEVVYGSMRVRDRVFQVAFEPGAEVQSVDVFRVTPTSYIDLVTITTTVRLQHRPEPVVLHPWLRTRLRQQTPAQAPDPPLDVPNLIVPIPPDGPGAPPFP